MQSRGLQRRGRFIAVDCRSAGASVWSERARALAAECLAYRIDRVLIDATDCDPEGRHALREALTTLILAGIPEGFRLALVTNVSSLQASFGTLQRDLSFLQIPASCFVEDGKAMEWLRVPAPASASLSRERQEA